MVQKLSQWQRTVWKYSFGIEPGKKKDSHGVQQGSVLGPLLFFLCINV